MTWPRIVLLVWFALAALANVAAIGRKRDPITPRDAAAGLIHLAVLATLVTLV